MSKVVAKAIGFLALSCGLASTAFAGQWTPSARYGFDEHPDEHPHINQVVVSAPEIDPAGALSGLTLLLGGLAVVRGRAKK